MAVGLRARVSRATERPDASDECKGPVSRAKEGTSNPSMLRRCSDKKSPIFTANCTVCAEVAIAVCPRMFEGGTRWAGAQRLDLIGGGRRRRDNFLPARKINGM
ncbi:hypothetical protein NL676_039624 [Syzygium grande]|nr:hypothetical protein NL676_039624 [Syzygium grande]